MEHFWNIGSDDSRLAVIIAQTLLGQSMNDYIIDTFLSFWLWFWLSWLVSAVPTQLEQINKRMDRARLALAIERLLKTAIWLTAPLVAAYAFLLWRFSHLLWRANMWGIGAIGLDILLIVIGGGLIFCWVFGFLLLHSPYAKEVSA